VVPPYNYEQTYRKFYKIVPPSARLAVQYTGAEIVSNIGRSRVGVRSIPRSAACTRRESEHRDCALACERTHFRRDAGQRRYQRVHINQRHCGGNIRLHGLGTNRDQVPDGKPVGVKHRATNTSRAQELLGWEPKLSLSEDLAETIDWYVDQKDQ
jgi:hypothetical protein